MKTQSIIQTSPDEHVFIHIECPGRPPISLDLMNHHGRRGLGIRVDGMGMANLLVDVKDLPPKGEAIFRYCCMCGEKIRMHLSRDHQCAET